jgi:hypothetical protein
MVSILVTEPMGQGAQPFIDPIPEPAALMHVLDPCSVKPPR